MPIAESVIIDLPRQPAAEPPREIELAIVVPTYREHHNIAPLIEQVDVALQGIGWELIFVDDDSDDATADRVWEIARTDRRIRCQKRVGRRGLSSACIEGLLSSPAALLAVMDGDLQHDPIALREMLHRLRSGEADLVVASRYMQGGSVGEWDERRVKMSSLATRLARWVTRQDLSDPMSGFFMCRRQVFTAAQPHLSSLGFKILLDIVASSPDPLRLQEVPIRFRARQSGVSKLDTCVIWEYLLLIADKLVGRIVPVRFVAFGAVGLLGALCHFLVLSLAFKVFDVPFAASQAVAVIAAMAFNFSLNNVLTFSDVRLRGARWWRGLASYFLICGFGAVANVGIASFLFGQRATWLTAAVAGILVGSVWNYAVTSRYTWRTS